MSSVNLIGNILYPRKYGIGGISFDTILSEDHTSEVIISRNPVEVGLAVTDNIVPQPFQLMLEGVITASSSAFGLIDFGIQGAVRDLAGNVASTLGIENSLGNKVSKGWEAMSLLMRSGERMTVITGLKQYENMALSSVSTKQDKDSPDHIKFTAILQEVLVVDTKVFAGSLGDIKERPESVNEVAKTNQPTSDRGSNILTSGKKPGVAVTNQSALSKVRDLISGPSSSTSTTPVAIDTASIRMVS